MASGSAEWWTDNDRGIYCVACERFFGGCEPYDSHLTEKRHRKKAKKQQLANDDRPRPERGYLRSQAQLKVLCPGDAELADLCPGSQCRVDVADIGGQHVFTIQCLEDMNVASVAATWRGGGRQVHGQLVPPGGVRAATTMGELVAAQQPYTIVRLGRLQESQ